MKKKKWKNCNTICIMAILVLILVLSCGGGNRLSGTWECDDGCGETITFSGRNINWDGEKGTYSISGNSIEIVWSDGDIEVLSFSRTENTIRIDGDRFNRRR
jgi:hypothetical protein